MKDKPLARKILTISVPLLFAEATETLDHLIDSLFLARVGATELGALAVADSLLMLFLIIPLAYVDGIQLLTARRLGEGKVKDLGKTFNQGLLTICLIAVTFTVVIKLIAPPFSRFFLNSESVGLAMNGYLQIDAYSLPFAGISFACSALLTSMGRTRALIPASLLLLGADAVLNYLFIFGKYGFPEMGMQGAAIGSMGAEILAAAFLLYHIRHRKDFQPYRLFQFRKPDRSLNRRLGKLAFPMAALAILMDIRWLIFFLIIERVGIPALAAANIVFTCYIIFRIPVEGVSETAFSMVSEFIGANHGHRLVHLLNTATLGGLAMTFPFIILGLVFPEWLILLFTNDVYILNQGAPGLRIVALAMLVAVPAEMWLSGLVSTGATLAALGIETLGTIVMVGFTCLLILAFPLPVYMAWLALPTSALLSLGLTVFSLKSGRRCQEIS